MTFFVVLLLPSRASMSSTFSGAGPKPDDLDELMNGLIAAHNRMGAGNASAVVHAAAVAYGFVFLHPFGDGNGRIHRFLIHNILARRKFTPAGIIFPVSAAMLKNLADYDASLESFSRPLMELVEYSLDKQGRMNVHNDTAVWYKYIDMLRRPRLCSGSSRRQSILNW